MLFRCREKLTFHHGATSKYKQSVTNNYTKIYCSTSVNFSHAAHWCVEKFETLSPKILKINIKNADSKKPVS